MSFAAWSSPLTMTWPAGDLPGLHHPAGDRHPLGPPVNRRITRSYVQEPGSVPVMVSEHRAILEAARAADEDRLVRLATEHIYTGYRQALPADSGLELVPGSKTEQSR
ncbi:FCD domain-containing protein [Streptomyces sp. NPDC005708]|uniref:FCD domain-containing protein n=1 Tax=Streptomyces sp. NPDC005708 TaxID=3154564 RepID=UPI0034042004